MDPIIVASEHSNVSDLSRGRDSHNPSTLMQHCSSSRAERVKRLRKQSSRTVCALETNGGLLGVMFAALVLTMLMVMVQYICAEGAEYKKTIRAAYVQKMDRHPVYGPSLQSLSDHHIDVGKLAKLYNAHYGQELTSLPTGGGSLWGLATRQATLELDAVCRDELSCDSSSQCGNGDVDDHYIWSLAASGAENSTDFTMGKHGVTVVSVAAAHRETGLREGDLVLKLAGVNITEDHDPLAALDEAEALMRSLLLGPSKDRHIEIVWVQGEY